MTEVSTITREFRALPDDELCAAYHGADERAGRRILAEAARRDQADRQARLRRTVRAEWYDAMFAQYMAAEAECRGNLLSREGLREGIADPISLWSGPRDRAMRLASEELRDYWLVHPRMTITEYLRQRSTAGRIARAEYREARFCTDTRGVTADGQDAGGAGLADDDTRPLRRVPAASEAPQAERGTVQRGGRGAGTAADGQAACGAGGPGGTFRVTAPVVNGRRLVAVALDGRRLTVAWVAEG
jgi:hypothetical protein